jgi:hypothetical protein
MYVGRCQYVHGARFSNAIVYLAAQIIPDVFIVAATPGLSYSLHLIKNEIETDAFFFKATGMMFTKQIGNNSVSHEL